MLQSPSPSPLFADEDRSDEDMLASAFMEAPEASRRVADWISGSQKMSAHFLAEKACEMVCYLWFSSNLAKFGSAARRKARMARRTAHGRSYSPSVASLSNERTALLQFSASPAFVQFMKKLLETTQVSQSVIVLSLHYIYRLKSRNELTEGMAGSEFRVAVVALMLANKFVDEYVLIMNDFFLIFTDALYQQYVHEQDVV